MIRNNNEFAAKAYVRKDNSNEYDKEPLVFWCRVATDEEKGMYQIANGILGSDQSISLYSQDMPFELKQGDHVEWQGKTYIVVNFGYYYSEKRRLSSHRFNPKLVRNKLPKGIVLQ